MSRRTKVFDAASSGGEQRVRTAVGIARRLADVGLRYRLRELQLLAFPCAMVFVPALFASPTQISPIASAIALCLVYLAANAALTLALPWVDQHVLPVLAMLLSTHYALAILGSTASSARIEWETSFPLVGGLIALYAALGVRLVRLALPPAKPERVPGPPTAPKLWPLRAGATLLLLATGVLTAAVAQRALA